jgi:hemoglobin/transferrin/lactoferrin receptor protein
VIWNAREENDFSWSGNLGIIYSVKKEIDLTFNLSRSFRSPSLEERYQYIDLGSLLRIGNPDLSPEKGLFSDAGLRLWYPGFSFSGNIFYNAFNDLVTEVPGTYEGRSALIKTNIGDARLYGYDFSFMYNFFKSFVAYGNLSYVRGEDTKNNLNLPQIPPLNGILGLKFSLYGILNADINSVLSEKQKNAAPGEVSSAGYVLFNAGFSSMPFIFNKNGNLRLTVFAGAENILDKDYRNFLSTVRGNVVTEPGRNFYLKLKFDI